ncbi:F-box domain-containing protein [Mycena chlorophos]|uniref:F-box domain-containing protein n=1 Tax=Mycena chlorophos TaxID=658473 RepID=A0A8H6TNZ8_MYCCL|nr:F-box domain-containing protein [Mycena chlorophos]
MPPPQTEAAALRCELAALQSAILQAQCTLDDLHRAKASVEDKLRNVFFPIRRVPAEVLGEIFSHFVLVASPAHHARNTLLLVCRHWRDVALAWPSLWTHIDFDCRRLESGRSDEAILRLVCRSGRLRIDLSITLPDDLEGCRTVLRLLNPSFHRLRSLKLASNLNFTELKTRDLPSSLPVLENLSMDVLFAHSDVPIVSCQWPALRRMSLTNKTKPSGLCASFHNLTYLKMDSYSALEVRNMLQRCPTLQELHLSLVNYDFDPLPAGTLIRLAQLHTLGLAANAMSIIPELFLPVLKKLICDGMPVPDSFIGQNGDIFAELVNRSQCRVESVDIREADPYRLGWLLHRFPYASLLTVRSSAWKADSFGYLNHSLAAVEELTLEGIPHGMDMTGLVSLVEERGIAGTGRLKRVAIAVQESAASPKLLSYVQSLLDPALERGFKVYQLDG